MVRPLFKTSPTFGVRVILLAVLALLFAHFDKPMSSFHHYREQAEFLVAPLRWLVNDPIQWGHRAMQGMTLQQHLLMENEQLRSQAIILQSHLQQLLTLQRENQQLKALLQSSTNVTGRVLLAELLAVSLDPELHQLILDKGARQQVYIGQPVFDAYGVMGQVIDVAPDTSKVLLLTDMRSAIPVESYRTGLRAIVQGTGDPNHLQLINVSRLADVKVGDLFVTSGYGGRFPGGYPVGVVRQVTKSINQEFSQVTILPSAHLDQTDRVLLIWPSQLKLRDQVQQLLAMPLPQPTQSVARDAL